MTKFLLTMVILFSIGALNANGGIFTPRESQFILTNCLSDNVLNCNGEADGHHVVEQEVECPLGGEKFKAVTFNVYSTYGRHLDWEPISYMRFPIPLPVCPSNGLVVTKKKYSKDELVKLKKVVESSEYKDLYSQKHATYFLFAKMIELQEEKSEKVDFWWLYLNATWEADKCKNKKRYKEYALETISASKKKLAKSKDSSEIYWVLKVVIANMYRRIGDFKTAHDLADKFGAPALKEKSANEFYLLALRVLKKAVKEKTTDRVPIKEDKKKDKNKNKKADT